MVKVRLAPVAVADLLKVRSEWIANSLTTAVEDKDGWQILTLDYERLEFALGPLLQLGDKVEVLEPEDLRRQLKEITSRSAALYETTGSMEESR